MGIFYSRIALNETLNFPNNAYLPTGYTDSDWAGPLNGDRKSTSRYVFQLTDSLISWCSVKQPCVSLSLNEAKYVALSEAVREATWIQNLMGELRFISTTSSIRIFADNKGAIDLTKVVTITTRSKHIDTRFHFSC